jgi:hypothetical protein
MDRKPFRLETDRFVRPAKGGMVPIAAPLASAPLMLRRELADGLTVGEGYLPCGSTRRRAA